MITVDLAAAARDEARRLTEGRALIAASRPFVADAPLVGIARRHRLRAALGRRILLVYRCACEDATGRLVHSTLVPISVALRHSGSNIRRARWSDPPFLARIDEECRLWCETAQRITRAFTTARLSRERAMAASHPAAGLSFQPGLFDRRAHRTHVAYEQDADAVAARLTARIGAVEAAGALTVRTPELLLVLIPRDAARV